MPQHVSTNVVRKIMEKIVSIRGAITVKENSVKEIKEATKELVREIFKQNNLVEPNIINIIFTVTSDLDVINPATIAREEFKISLTPMLCVQEMNIKNGLSKCIRILIQTYSELKKEEIKHVYLGKATNLRPDLSFDV